MKRLISVFALLVGCNSVHAQSSEPQPLTYDAPCEPRENASGGEYWWAIVELPDESAEELATYAAVVDVPAQGARFGLTAAEVEDAVWQPAGAVYYGDGYARIMCGTAEYHAETARLVEARR
jgi:hypothetical protein